MSVGNLFHIAEVAALLLLAYVVGWIVGYVARAASRPRLRAVTAGPVEPAEASLPDALVKAPVIAPVPEAPPPPAVPAAGEGLLVAASPTPVASVPVSGLESLRALSTAMPLQPAAGDQAERAPGEQADVAPPAAMPAPAENIATAPAPDSVAPASADTRDTAISDGPTSGASRPASADLPAAAPGDVVATEPVAKQGQFNPDAANAVLAAEAMSGAAPVASDAGAAAPDGPLAVATSSGRREEEAEASSPVPEVPAAAPASAAGMPWSGQLRGRAASRFDPSIRRDVPAPRPATAKPAASPPRPPSVAPAGARPEPSPPVTPEEASLTADAGQPEEERPSAGLDVALLASIADELRPPAASPPVADPPEAAPVLDAAPDLRQPERLAAAPTEPESPAPVAATDAASMIVTSAAEAVPAEEPSRILSPEPLAGSEAEPAEPASAGSEADPSEPDSAASKSPAVASDPRPVRDEFDEDAAMRAIEGGWSRRDVRAMSGAPELPDVSAAVSAAQVAVEQVLARNRTAGTADERSPAGFGKPRGLPAPRNGVRDNLKQIDGLGPLDESSLNNLGIYHFDQVAAWDEREILWLENHAFARGRIGREQWQAQARTLAGDGDTLRARR